MKRKRKYQKELVLLILLMAFSLNGCAFLLELIPSGVNFGLGLYNADTYVTKDCKWYEPVWFSAETKACIKKKSPPEKVVKDIAKVSRNNDLYKELCDDLTKDDLTKDEKKN